MIENKCKYCGATITNENMVCDYCGAVYTEPSPIPKKKTVTRQEVKRTDLQKENEAKTKHKRVLFENICIIIAVILTAVASFGMVFWLFSSIEEPVSNDDTMSMSKVVNMVETSLSNEDIYEEVWSHAAQDNISRYYDAKVIGEQYGVTITFEPSDDGAAYYIIKDGIVNKYVGTTCKVSDLPLLSEYLQRTVGESIKLTTEIYDDMEYTVFIYHPSSPHSNRTYGYFENGD